MVNYSKEKYKNMVRHVIKLLILKLVLKQQFVGLLKIIKWEVIWYFTMNQNMKSILSK